MKKYETGFHDEKTRLHMAEVSFLIAKTAMCKRIPKFQSKNSKSFRCMNDESKISYNDPGVYFPCMQRMRCMSSHKAKKIVII